VRIAILSDIHGNLLALEAVMADMEVQRPDQVWCGGDLGWLGPWATECIGRVREAGWPTVKGNTDVWITGDPQTVSSEEERANFKAIAEQHDVAQDDADWLLNLPLGHTGTGSVLLVHGTPDSPFRAPMPDDPAPDFAPYEDHATVVVYAHVHRAFIRRLSGGTLVANTGAVGLPMDGDTASYLLIDRRGPDITLRHRRVTFDRRAGLAEAKRIGGPIGERFAEMLGPA
jgi:predicted phosphodiesterase